ncbi:MAG TPA: ATP-binding protein [Acidimicrobiales bacterium]|nr:ATP-binding protein [Acidimicrobiales bacterium]
MNDEVHQLHLPCRLSSVKLGRHFARDVLAAAGLVELCDTAQLGTSELVANAVRHAGTDILLTVSLSNAVTISIEDHQPELRRPMPPRSDELGESGRGLHIVAAVSQDWGVRSIAGGKVIWFTLSLPQAGAPDARMLHIHAPRALPGEATSQQGRQR